MPAPPIATYRLQLNADFTLEDAAELADYLAALGVSHAYLSPVLRSRQGSAHGYDVVDARRIDEELGGSGGFDHLRSALGERGLELVLDIVPNHMSASHENPWWKDVLLNGPASPHARCFDVDWPSDRKLRLPILPEPCEALIAKGALRVERRPEGFVLATPSGDLPLSPASLRAAGTPFPAEAVNADEEALASLLDQQVYRLASWRDVEDGIDYRRFFDINDLVGLRVEDEEVFERTHALVAELASAPEVDGVRVDHIDGLRDPEDYLQRLRARAKPRRIWVEKILDPAEELPHSWPVDGTTGYDFLRTVDGLFVDPEGREPLTRFYTEFTGERRDFAEVAHEAKRDVLDRRFRGEVAHLAADLTALAKRHLRPVEPDTALAVVRVFLASLPVYRTYVRPGNPVRAEDLHWIDEAAREARKRRPDGEAALVVFVRDLLLLRWDGEREADFCLRFQQLSPAVTAKGVEDTAFYRYLRLVSLNEVGGDPGRFGVGIDEFHRAMQRARENPLSLLATSTHDTKRSEDVRCRLAVLSELPEAWVRAVRHWAAHNAERHPVPDRHAEYLLYQTLVGAWPIDVERAQAYARKASREAKRHTSWVAPDDDYERALLASIAGMLDDADFRASLATVVAMLVEPGRVNSLAQLLVKLTAPGVPDVYQGTELWSLRLVDPDNRAPVDYALRRRLLSELRNASPAEVLGRADEGLPKLWLLRAALAARRRNPGAFGPDAAYTPLATGGAHRSRVVAYLRGEHMAIVVPRLVARLAGSWGDTAVELPAGRWSNELTGEKLDGGEVPIGLLLAGFPVALLARGARF